MVTLTILLLLLLNSSSLVNSIWHNHGHHSGPITNVTKHLYFSSFDPDKNPSIVHEIKLLGSAKLSRSDTGSIQIPDASPTIDHRNQAGRAIYSSPIRLFDPLTQNPASFHTTFSFRFNAAAAETEGVPVSGSGGGGLAFVIVPDEFTVGRPGPWLGMLNDACDEHYKVFAIEFDASHDPEFGDPKENHVGIDLGSVVSSKTAGVSLNDGSVRRAWIIYDGHHRWLEVYLGSDGEDFPSEPILSMPINLSSFLKEYMFVGFAASTGTMPEVHNLLSWNFSSTIQAPLQFPSTKTCEKKLAFQVSKNSGIAHTKPPSSFMIFLAVVGLFTLALLNLYCNSKCRENSSAFVLPETKQRPIPPYKTGRLTMHEVYRATRSFSRVEVLGSDSTGVLYRGIMTNGCRVAVKRFSAQFLADSGLDHRRVLKRIREMTRVNHHSLAPIRGWCFDDRETIVLYDYFQNGNVDRWLFGVGVIPWSWRFKIIKKVANALSFLHSNDLSHGSLKISSVFIDSSYQVALGDYGLMNSEKSDDVFGFGMLALEMVSGKKSSGSDGDEDQKGSLLGFAWRMHERGEKVGILDQRMGLSLNLEMAFNVLEIGLICTLDEDHGRPSMEEVLQFLNLQKPIPNLPKTRSAVSNFQEQR